MNTVQTYANNAYQANIGSTNFASLTPEAIARTLFIDYAARTPDAGLTKTAPSPSWYKGFINELTAEFAAHGLTSTQQTLVIRSLSFTLFQWEILGIEQLTVRYSLTATPVA